VEVLKPVFRLVNRLDHYVCRHNGLSVGCIQPQHSDHSAAVVLVGNMAFLRSLSLAASRELLFIDDEELVYRRPVSLLGHTAAYDLAHVTPFYFSDVHNCLAFDYAYLHVYFGYDLPRESAEALIAEVNQQWFPDMMPADDAEE
jgi:hypothetical protein